MEAAKLIVSIVLCLSILVIGGGLLGAVIWLGLRVHKLVAALDALEHLGQKVIASESQFVVSADSISEEISSFSEASTDVIKNLAAHEEAMGRVVSSNIVSVEGLAKTVQKFQRALLDTIPGKSERNYDVSPEVEGLTQAQIEEREASEILKAQKDVERIWNSPPEIIKTEDKA